MYYKNNVSISIKYDMWFMNDIYLRLRYIKRKKRIDRYQEGNNNDDDDDDDDYDESIIYKINW